MKRTIGWLIGAFWFALISVLVFYGVERGSTGVSPNTPIINNATGPDYQPANNTQPTSPAAGTYTMAQVATHNSASSCWLAIGGQAYNVTNYIKSHPGGTRNIVSYCGQEATAAFAGHSSYAQGLLKNYLVGKISG